MHGKESDIRLALAFREKFVCQYNDDEVFKAFLNQFEKDCLDKLVHKLTKETKANITKCYKVVKERVAYMIEYESNELFKLICQIEEARTWINDNGKFTYLAFEVAYNWLKKDSIFNASLL